MKFQRGCIFSGEEYMYTCINDKVFDCPDSIFFLLLTHRQKKVILS